MNPFVFLDNSIVSGLDVFARRSWGFDHAVSALAENNLLKGAAVVALFWWAWFRAGQGAAASNRAHVIATMLGCLAALAVGRLLVLVLPFRARPIHESALGFIAPYGVNSTVLAKASSFPSDHAVLFFALATGLFFVSRRAAISAIFYTFAVIALPRMYLGWHYFSDILAGAVVGASISWAANRLLPESQAAQAILRFSSARPMYFYPLLFLVTFEVAELFEGIRAIVGGLLKLLS